MHFATNLSWTVYYFILFCSASNHLIKFSWNLHKKKLLFWFVELFIQNNVYIHARTVLSSSFRIVLIYAGQYKRYCILSSHRRWIFRFSILCLLQILFHKQLFSFHSLPFYCGGKSVHSRILCVASYAMMLKKMLICIFWLACAFIFFKR